ncbi:hypothetical protein GQ54DRAFT_61460 [Martensiomyces pterosporus]|nr:hypothetical protein GQ54DRAFT_61460 [Martensiomyces pterosporus]
MSTMSKKSHGISIEVGLAASFFVGVGGFTFQAPILGSIRMQPLLCESSAARLVEVARWFIRRFAGCRDADCALASPPHSKGKIEQRLSPSDRINTSSSAQQRLA